MQREPEAYKGLCAGRRMEGWSSDGNIDELWRATMMNDSHQVISFLNMLDDFFSTNELVGGVKKS